MSIKKKHMNWMMLCKLPLGASLWAILFFFIFTACQDDAPYEDTEVMMTFTTRAVVTQNNESDAINIEKMNDLRVIMVREDGTIAYKEVNEINGTSVTVTFNTPVKTGGENFQFFAIANEDDILPPQNLGSIQSGDIEALKNRIVGNGSEFSINNAIPQTKYWTAKVNPYESLSVSQQLDYLVSKISVQFKNETNKAQSLSNIHITGITPNGNGRLFNHPTGDKDANGEEIYEEVYVTTNDVTLNNGIAFDGVTNLPSGESSAIQHYYTYPVDNNGNISSPTLHATWNGKNYTLPLEGITELKRNDHLKIIVTLTGQELVVNYTIAPWNTDKSTYIGSPTIGGGYNTEDWTAGGDVNIGGDPVVPNPGGGNGGSGDYIWSIDNPLITPNYGSEAIQQAFSSDQLNELVVGRYLGVLYDVAEPDNGRELYIKDFNSTENSNKGTLPSFNGNVFNLSGQTEFVLTESDVNAIKNNGGGLAFWGNGFTITKIYVRNP